MSTGVIAESYLGGLQLKFTKADYVVANLGLSKQVLEQLLSRTPQWPLPLETEVWMLAHHAIRRDLDSLVEGVTKTKAQVDSGAPLQAWQARSLRHASRDLQYHLISYLRAEQRVVLPLMRTRVRGALHTGVKMGRVVALAAHMSELCGPQLQQEGLPALACKAVLSDLLSTTLAVRTLVCRHLEEEEVLGLPLLRMHFSGVEGERAEGRLLATMRPKQLAWMLRHLDAEARSAVLKRWRAHMPSLLQQLVLRPAMRADAEGPAKAHQQLATGQQQPSAASM